MTLAELTSRWQVVAVGVIDDDILALDHVRSASHHFQSLHDNAHASEKE